MNFQELVRESRLEKAAVLLSSSDYPVEKIAQAVGYQNAVPHLSGDKSKNLGVHLLNTGKATVK